MTAKQTNKKAEFILSLDFELGWGAIENGLWQVREKKGVYKRLRPVLSDFLSELDSLELPVTWAFVGAMLEEPKKRQFDHLPLDFRTKAKAFSQTAEDTTSDARDLFEQILSAKTRHALSSHTYSHIRFNYPGLTASNIDTEMCLFADVCKQYNVCTDSLVFPQNIEGFHDQLKRSGYQSVRTSPDRKDSKNKFAHLLTSVISPPPLSKGEIMDNGLERQSGSMFFNTGINRLHRLPFIYKQAISGINHAIKTNGTIHLWIHPFNLSESFLLFPSLMKVMKYVVRKRDKRLIQVNTFG